MTKRFQSPVPDVNKDDDVVGNCHVGEEEEEQQLVKVHSYLVLKTLVLSLPTPS